METKEKSSWILYMATFPPRECGIATFTKDLTTAMDKRFNPLIKSKIVAMNNDVTSIYNYPKDVILQVNDADIQEYIDLAKRINKINRIKLVSIQHEFGIFGGEYGSYLIAFLEMINKPVVLTFHSVIPAPNDKQKMVVQRLAEKSECIIVMTRIAADILRKDYGITTDIKVVSHGIPTVQFVPSIKEKIRLGYRKRTVLLSFGMMSPGKGYEYVIESLPKVVEKFPDILYLIVGETHPVIRMKEGEQYRNFLEKKVKELKLEKYVKFYNKYVTLEEIMQYLQAADIYICSNQNPNQVTSGTLAYAGGAGRAVISTPFLHAKEFVTPEIGEITEFKNPDSFSDAIINILSDPELKKKMERKAYMNTRHMTWGNVALAYSRIFGKYVAESEKYGAKIPKVSLKHLIKLTDNFGVIQFANNTQPDRSSGYSVDDVARAMIVCSMYQSIFKDNSKLRMIKIYLDFIKHVQQTDGRIYNFVDVNKKVDLEQWSDDAHGRTLWALGYLISSERMPEEFKKDAEKMFNKAIPIIHGVKSPRAVAFAILGLYFYNKAKPSPENVSQIKKMADHLVMLYTKHSSDEWQWFEDTISYSNSKLSEALFYAYLVTKDEQYLKVAKSSLDFLRSITFEDKMFAPVGQNGWYIKNGQKAHFDQQPVESFTMVQTLILANKVTNNEEYLKEAVTAFHWFLGKNRLNRMIYDESTGGCHDGIGESAVNLNQGAESTISYLIARLTLLKEDEPKTYR